MPKQFLHKNRNYRKPITYLALALLMTSCAGQKLPDEPTTVTSGNTPEETVVAEETTAPPSTQASQESKTNTVTEVATSSQTSNTQKVNIETVLKDFDQGTPYAVVRDRLIKEGWVPVEAPNPGDFGVEREAYDAGFTEVTACAGTGLGQCQFNFENPAGQKGLSITTYGGSEFQFGDWNISSNAATSSLNGNGEIVVAEGSELIQEGHSEIPAQFQGEWNMDLEGCGSLLSDGRLEIGPNQLQFYESVGTVSNIMVTGTAGLTVTSEYFSEGETFTDTDSFQLSGDNLTLTHLGTNTVRYRCS
ncbi:hypothetical protein Lepto7376_1344 [[Leptolyngbya] sp. PCC 7376]|uniref:hypothetical protein n=1 Tax=[Leptolyngbya] sp. PCC 7376 TaxID=111781 RepID=UPI00029EDF36|nr:hypothetical protein [[Leptolyngbya] sp. PCC 7376]AFY37696.1 hypothetical protein Lepto7376_1344 [[Leptolyngbya] sp. PCC 7376]